MDETELLHLNQHCPIRTLAGYACLSVANEIQHRIAKNATYYCKPSSY